MAWLPKSPFTTWRPKGKTPRAPTTFSDREERARASYKVKAAPPVKKPAILPGKTPAGIVKAFFDGRSKDRSTPADFRPGERGKGGPNITPVPFPAKPRPKTTYSDNEDAKAPLGQGERPALDITEPFVTGSVYEIVNESPTLIKNPEEVRATMLQELPREHPELDVIDVVVDGQEVRVIVRQK